MRAIVCLYLLILGGPSFSQEQDVISGKINKDKLPVPSEINQLFYLQRDPDLNTVVYVLNIKNGELNKSDPVLPYWIRYADKAQIQKLSFIQRRMAYGINHTELESGVFELHIQAYKPLKILLSKNEKSGRYQALVKIKEMEILLTRIFVRINGGSILKPNVQYIEICGHNAATGKEINYRFDL